MRYPIMLEPHDGGYVVSFPDIPEALTQGDTREEALAMGLDALVTSFEFYFEDNRPVPEPGLISGDFVEVPASVSAKVLLLNAFLSSGLTQVELATRMGVKKQEVTRIFDLHHSTKIDTIQKALAVMGVSLSVRAEGQLDVYTLKNGEYTLPRRLCQGARVKFIACPALKPAEIAVYSAEVVHDERQDSSFLVIRDPQKLELESPDMELVSSLSVSLTTGQSAIPVNCVLPESY